MYNTPCSRSILIIDDDDALRRSIVGFLEDTGFEVHQACSGKEGIRIFTELSPDLVLTDLMMPELDGLGVVNAIKQHSPDTPIVVISGNGSVGYAIETMRQGAWDYITKPIHDFSVLERTINTVTTRSDEVQAARKRVQELDPQFPQLMQRGDGLFNILHDNTFSQLQTEAVRINTGLVNDFCNCFR